jgi:hypothetical protein
MGQTRSFADVGSMSGLLESGHWSDDLCLLVRAAGISPRITVGGSPKREPRPRTSGPSILVVVTGNFLHEHHDPAPHGGIINSQERSDQP